MDKFLLVILVILGQLLIPTTSYRSNFNAAKMKPNSPQVVLVNVWDMNTFCFHENRNGFIVNEKLILTWGPMSPEHLLVIQYKFSWSFFRSLYYYLTPWADNKKNGWKGEDQMIGVNCVKRHPCIPELALIELEKPLDFNQHFQPIKFHADYQNEIGQNIDESWIESWSWDVHDDDIFFEFQRSKVNPILKSSTKNLNQTQNYYNTTYAYSSYKVQIDKFGAGKNKNEAAGQCLFPCLFPGAGLFVREKGQNKSYLAGIAYPDPNHKIFTHIDSDKTNCPLNLKFLDLSKMLCWISGSSEFSPNCSNPEGYEDNCQISDINKNWRKSYFDYLTVENIVLSSIFILFCILIYLLLKIVFRT